VNTPATAPLPHVLVVDDDPSIRALLADYLGDNEMRVTAVASGAELAQAMARELVDLVVLDVRLPGEDGMQIARRLRESSAIPILMLTGRAEEADRVMGLELGADDYLTKPFSPRELYLRISAVLRRVKKVTHVSEITRGRFMLDRKNLKLYLDGTPLDLTTIEFKLLTTLMENDSAVHSRADLLRDVWGYNSDVATRTLDTHIKRLREKLGSAGDHIVTIRGTGFQFQTELAASQPA